MATTEVDVRRTVPAPPPVVFRYLADRTTWPTWSGHDRFELLQPGATERQGVGAIGLLYSGRNVMREEIVELQPDRRVSYALLEGMPLRDYRADVDLEPAGAGTAVRWHSRFEAPFGTGWLYRLVLTLFITRALRGLSARVAIA